MKNLSTMTKIMGINIMTKGKYNKNGDKYISVQYFLE